MEISPVALKEQEVVYCDVPIPSRTSEKTKISMYSLDFRIPLLEISLRKLQP